MWLFKIKKPEAAKPRVFCIISPLCEGVELVEESVAEPVEALFASYCCNSWKNLSFEVFEQCTTSC
jgi:hypothetical protein